MQVRSLLSLFVDIERTDRSNAFYEKFNTRYKAGQILGVHCCLDTLLPWSSLFHPNEEPQLVALTVVLSSLYSLPALWGIGIFQCSMCCTWHWPWFRPVERPCTGCRVSVGHPSAPTGMAGRGGRRRGTRPVPALRRRRLHRRAVPARRDTEGPPGGAPPHMTRWRS